jgi:uncharacterized protein YhaN
MASSPQSDDTNSKESRKNVLQFSQLCVQRLYGIDHDLEVGDLCGDINVVYGSNASGKTTLAQGLRMLLWPDRAEDESPILSGQFTLDESSWRVRLEGGESRYQRGQQVTGPPALPPSSHDSRYHLYLPHLLATTDGDGDFARLIMQEAQGGVDLEGAARDLGFEVPSRRKSKSAKAVEELREQISEVESKQEELRQQERKLTELRRKRDEAQEAAKRVTALEQAVEVAEAREQHEEAAGALETFPDVMEKVDGDEDERLDSLQQKKKTAQEEIDEAQEEIDEAETTIADSILPEDGLPEGHIKKIRVKQSTLQESERKVREISADLKGAETREEKAWERLSAGVNRENAAEIDLPTVEEVESHVENVESLQGERQALDRLQHLLADTEPEDPVDTLRDGLRALHRWLQHPEPTAGDRSRLHTALLVGIGVLVAGAGGFLTVSEAGLVLWMGVVLIVLGAAVVAIVLRAQSGDSETGEEVRSIRQSEFERTGLDAPDAWTQDAVERHADQMLKRLREAEVAAEKASEWERLRPDREEAEKRAETLETERKRLAEEIGFNPDVSSRSLAWLVDRLSQWQSAHEEVDGLRAAKEEAERTSENVSDDLSELLARYGFDEVEDSSDAQEALTALETAQDDFRDAKSTLNEAQRRKERAEANLQEAETKIEALYERLNLQVGQENELRALADQHSEYEAGVDAEKKAATLLSNERKRLRRCEKHEEWMEEATREDLRHELEQARSKAEKKEEHIKEINTIETKIEEAQKGQTLEQLRAKYRDKRDGLVRDRDRDYMKAGGSIVTDFVQERTRNQGLPPVFDRARELFADITNDRYELLLDPQTASFRAHDHVEDRDFALEELSSGTKVQLLLAVRVAFVESKEQGCRAPLVLDEALANSDEERAWAIIQAIQTICRDGRQILYLTAQQDEVKKWKAAQRQWESDVNCEVIRLSSVETREFDDLGGDGAVVPSGALAVDVPDDDTLGHDELGKVLDVPRWSPREPVKRLHLWYLVEDPDPLIDLVQDGTTTWGQLRFQYRRGGPVAVKMDEEAFRHVDALARAVESWKEAWLIGRGRPVDRTVLQDSGAVSDHFINDVSDLAEDLDGEAEALLQELREKTDERAKGFYSSKADELEAYLEEEGYIDRRETKAPEEMWQFVLADLAQQREDGVVEKPDLERLFDRIQSGPPVGN